MCLESKMDITQIPPLITHYYAVLVALLTPISRVFLFMSGWSFSDSVARGQVSENHTTSPDSCAVVISGSIPG